MKRAIIYISVAVMILGVKSCGWLDDGEPIKPEFEDLISESIYDYIRLHDTTSGEYGDFLRILEVAGIDKTLSAYNPEGLGYTLFLPTNEAVGEFIAETNEYGSLEELLADVTYVSELARFHVVRISLEANDFPFGALPKRTMSGDFLTISFVLGADSTTYKVNNQADVIQEDIEMSNGYIHIVESMLSPITKSTYEVIKMSDDFSIFTAAVEATGFIDVLSRDIKDEDNPIAPVTLLVEPDSIYAKRGIHSFEDLVTFLGAENDDYTNPDNIVNVYTGFHILDAYRFLLDFEEDALNYSTYTNLPVYINGEGLEIVINKGKQIFDTLVSGTDTTIIDFIGILYDESNILSKSGAIHLINQVMEPKTPSRQRVNCTFWDEPLFLQWRDEPGEYLIEDSTALTVISWTGPEMSYVKSGDTEHRAWSQDYITIDGDFRVRYNIQKIVQGSYTMFLRANAYGSRNAAIEVYVDGTKVGGVIDLSNYEGLNAQYPGDDIEVGTVTFTKYERHIIELRSLIPGVLEWDAVYFDIE